MNEYYKFLISICWSWGNNYIQFWITIVLIQYPSCLWTGFTASTHATIEVCIHQSSIYAGSQPMNSFAETQLVTFDCLVCCVETSMDKNCIYVHIADVRRPNKWMLHLCQPISMYVYTIAACCLNTIEVQTTIVRWVEEWQGVVNTMRLWHSHGMSSVSRKGGNYSVKGDS